MENSIGYFIDRLDDWATIDIIRDINLILQRGYGEEELLSDPYEDLDIKISYPNFHVDENILSLIDMKTHLYNHLNEINPLAREYFDDIELCSSSLSTFRQWELLKFKIIKSKWGFKKYICESLTNHGQPFCFVQYCSKRKCRYMINKIDKSLAFKTYNKVLFTDYYTNISIKIFNSWFKIGNLSNDNHIAFGTIRAKQLLEEWIDFKENN
jgi:hypothetical protein